MRDRFLSHSRECATTLFNRGRLSIRSHFYVKVEIISKIEKTVKTVFWLFTKVHVLYELRIFGIRYMHIRICLGQFLKTNFSLHFLNIFEFLAKIALRELFYRFCAWEEKKQAFNNIGMTGKSDEPRMPTKYFRYHRTLNFEEETLL